VLRCFIPHNNVPERRYILEIVLGELLGLEVLVDVGSENYEILLPNGKKLTIEDTFFNKYPNELEYLKLENIPSSIEELDIFSQCFFMLTRWEEYVNKNRDAHGRFPATESLAFKEGFLDRPLVNENVEVLKKKLLELDSSLLFKSKRAQLFLTHDVDELYMWKSWRHVFRVALGDVLKRRSIILAWSRVKEYFLVQKGVINDPFDTFDWLMDKSEAIGVKSRFYFMSGGVTVYDNRYKIDEPKALELIAKIKKRGHIIGIHPSYNAYNDFEQFRKEKTLLEKVVNEPIVEGREHYLRFEVPTTWQVWEENGMKVDSTCGYADKEGFRCGTGDEFSVFNILTRKKLGLKERPLVVMDCSLFHYNNYSYTEATHNIQELKKDTNTFTMLWHNSYIRDKDFYGEQFEKNNINSTK
jgi:hypothetical protein